MKSIAPKYMIKLRNQTFDIVAIFDSWLSLGYTKKVNGIHSCSLSLNSNDSRCSLFELDGLVEIWRTIPGITLPWYREFIGFHRGIIDSTAKDSKTSYVSNIVGLNDLLARTIINYVPATIKSYKNAPAETAMKEYVEENCGASATIANGRESNGVLPYFINEVDGALGAVWEGDRAWENLLDVLQDISRFSNIDFDVDWDSASEQFVFRTYESQYGEDRTIVGLNSTTGLNAAGNSPVIFSLERGNLSSIERVFDRLSESNVVTVTGDGDGATVAVEVRISADSASSPWNRREVCRPQSGFVSEMQTYGDSVLAELSAKDILHFVPLLQPECMYGKHFFIGDKVSVLFKGTYYALRIFSVTNSNVGKAEDISITFSELQ
jgi:hypothetical protein